MIFYKSQWFNLENSKKKMCKLSSLERRFPSLFDQIMILTAWTEGLALTVTVCPSNPEVKVVYMWFGWTIPVSLSPLHYKVLFKLNHSWLQRFHLITIYWLSTFAQLAHKPDSNSSWRDQTPGRTGSRVRTSASAKRPAENSRNRPPS